MHRLGAKAITALITPDRQVAWQILALNTEKAHNLKERALEVARIYRGLIDDDASRHETDFAFYLEDAALVTLGFCYEQRKTFPGGAYHPILRRLEEFSEEPLRTTVRQHEKRASMVMDLDDRVSEVVERLKERGLVSPYLRTFVVARINPLRWMKGDYPPLEEVLKTMRERASKFNVEKIKPQDLASMAGAPPTE
jgi:ParB family chromosome partitioning protein